ncbi:winged helix-turn-helix domain-containing protein [Pseudomonas chlororaphis]
MAPTPFLLLCVLARQPGSLVSKDALLDAVWGYRFVSDSVLKTAISDLRKVLADDPRHPRFIETVSRRGYRFISVSPSPARAQSVLRDRHLRGTDAGAGMAHTISGSRR